MTTGQRHSQLRHGQPGSVRPAADDKNDIVDSMRRNDVLVEILLTSNAQILGVTGNDHPFPQYFRERRLPVAFSTDDEGVSYRNYTTEWLYAALRYNLNYDELVTLARKQPAVQLFARPALMDGCGSGENGSTTGLAAYFGLRGVEV
jgi:adenosine deaminase